MVIDTPGHESFTNLRARGSTLCDIAILVVDIMHGLEQQTRESLKLLRQRKCPFIVALNKVDRLFEWKSMPDADIQKALKKQEQHVQDEYHNRVNNLITAFAEEGFNAELYYKNKDPKHFISLVPTSAHSGEGICDLLIVKIQMVQRFIESKVRYKEDLECTVLEVKPIIGIGTTIDVILVNGTLRTGDRAVLCGINGPLVTDIRGLLTPQPMKELRVKSQYIHHNVVHAAIGVKVMANNLEEAVPGTPLFIANTDEALKIAKDSVMNDFKNILTKVSKTDIGVAVQSSTLGAMEALLCFLESSKIPVSTIGLGPLHKRHLHSIQNMREKNPKYAVVLAFDVAITPEAEEYAKANHIQIFKAQIIYHLFDEFIRYSKEYEERIKEKNRQIAIFPAEVKILGKINAKNPLIIHINVERGQLHMGTTLINSQKKEIGIIQRMQWDKKDITIAKRTKEAIIQFTSKENITYGRQIDEGDILSSLISRVSIDALKESFRDEMETDDWKLIKELANEQGVPVGGRKK